MYRKLFTLSFLLALFTAEYVIAMTHEKGEIYSEKKITLTVENVEQADSVAYTPAETAKFKVMLSPVPAEESVVLSYVLDFTRKVNLRITNSLAQIIGEKKFDRQTQGSYFLPIEIRDLAKGVYEFRLEIDGFTVVKRLVIE